MVKSSTVYIGNIDHQTPEHKIIEALSSIGRIVQFKNIVDRATNKSKGYAFCQYSTPEEAENAIKNLKIVFNGRPLKLNYADVDIEKEDTTHFVNVLNVMDKTNIKELILYLKKIAIDQPERLKDMLEENKALGIALMECFDELGLLNDVKPELLKQHFKIEDNQLAVLERICAMEEDEMNMFDEETKRQIVNLKVKLMKDKEREK